MKKINNKKKLLYKIMPIIRKSGVSQLKVDDIARFMDISKATLYKYFTSKDEIISSVVDMYVTYINEGQGVLKNNSISFINRYQDIFEQSLMYVTYVSDIFLQDIESIYPDQSEKITLAFKERNKGLQQFIQSGVKEGIFNPINSDIFMIQNEMVLRRIIEPSFSVQTDLTTKQAILEFFTIISYQLIQPSHLSSVDPNYMEVKISKLIQKIS